MYQIKMFMSRNQCPKMSNDTVTSLVCDVLKKLDDANSSSENVQSFTDWQKKLRSTLTPNFFIKISCLVTTNVT